MVTMQPFENSQVAAIFASYPPRAQKKLLALRQMIFDVAKRTPGVGALEETLRWGQPSYLTTHSGSGTTIRLDQEHKQPGQLALYVHCQTTLVADFKAAHGDALQFAGSRAVLLAEAGSLPRAALRRFIEMALTYHQKGASARRRKSSPGLRKKRK